MVLVALLIVCMAPRVTAADDGIISVRIRMRVDGFERELEAFNFERLSYVKLRDIAYVLNRTGKQFSIDYDSELRLVSIRTKVEYTPIGTELRKQPATVSGVSEGYSSLMVDGEIVEIKSYLVGGHNYYKLQDLASMLDFDITYDSIIYKAICVNTALGYNPDSQIPLFTRYYYYVTYKYKMDDGTEAASMSVYSNDSDLTEDDILREYGGWRILPGDKDKQIIECEQCTIMKIDRIPHFISIEVNGAYVTFTVDEYLAYLDTGLREGSLANCISEENYLSYLDRVRRGDTGAVLPIPMG